jgi:hypothetical protein
MDIQWYREWRWDENNRSHLTKRHYMQLIYFNCSLLLQSNILLLNVVLFLALSIDSRNVTQAFMLNTALLP